MDAGPVCAFAGLHPRLRRLVACVLMRDWPELFTPEGRAGPYRVIGADARCLARLVDLAPQTMAVFRIDRLRHLRGSDLQLLASLLNAVADGPDAVKRFVHGRIASEHVTRAVAIMREVP